MYYVSICSIIKDEDKYLDEWISYHIECGIDHIYLYDNGSTNPQQNCISERNLNYCTVIPFPLDNGTQQYKCYAEFLRDYGKNSKWVAFIDADEFIRVVDDTPIPEFLREYESHDGLYVGWLVYNANGQLTNDGRPVRERFTNTVTYKKNLPCGKSIIRPEMVNRMGPHFPAPVWYGQYDIVDENHTYICAAPGCEPSLNRIVIDHYFTKSWEEWQHKINKGVLDIGCIRKMEEFFYYNPDLADFVKRPIIEIT